MLRLLKSRKRIAPFLKAVCVILLLSANMPNAQAGFFSFIKNFSTQKTSSENSLSFADYNMGLVDGQTISVCSGNFYDSGGPSGDMEPMKNHSVTFCSDNGGAIVFDFAVFDMDAAWCAFNYLEVYNGVDASAPLMGTYCDDTPFMVTSTNSCLHFVFKSDFWAPGAGWEASISCTTPTGPGYASCVNTDEVGGLIFEDFDLDGTQDGNEPLYKDVTVEIYDESGLVNTMTTDSIGQFLFTGLTAGADYRLEYTIPTTHEEGPMGEDSHSSVQFVTAGTCDASLGLLLTDFYCPGTPDFATTCFVDGEPTGGGTSGPMDVLVSTAVTSSGTSATINKLAVNSEMGSVWGLAYEKSSKTIFSASFLKRHSGFGPLGLGGIYATDYTNPSSPVVTNWMDVDTLTGVDVGVDPRSYTLPANAGVAHKDSAAFSNVGKVGLGGMDVSNDGKTLYVMNLNGNGELLAIDIATKTLLSQTAVPNLNCGVGTDVRPFAVKVFKNEVYIGVVCSGETSGTLDLHFNVMKLSGGTFVNVIDAPLDFEKGSTHTDDPTICDRWETWTNDFADIHDDLGAIGSGERWCRNQPMLTDIEFDLNDDMVISFSDRGGHQLGYEQHTTTNTTIGSGYIGGDVLRVYNNSGTYVLESAGTTAGGGGGGANGQGPGGGEFYHSEFYETVIDTIHEETSNGGLALLPYENDLLMSSMDPLGLWSGGVIWLDNSTGNRTQELQLYVSSSGSGTFGKGSGIGDIQLLCEAAPVSIGNLVWWDVDKDGIQDPGEKGLANVDLTLTDASDVVLGTTTTDANGNYVFNNANVTGGLDYETDYKVKITVQDFQTVSPANATNDNIDNDGELDDVTVVATVTTGGQGEFTSNVDIGLTGTAGLGNRVWVDENADGIQNPGERGIPNVKVLLYDGSNNLINETITDADGGYIFKNLPTDTYVVKIGSGVPSGMTLIYDEDNGTTSPDGEVSATIPGVGEYVTADFGYNWVTKSETDNPTVMTIPGALGDRIWNDADADGKQNVGEAGIPNVTINLYNDPDKDGVYDNLVTSTTTDDYGYYIFNNLTPDAYEFTVVENDISTKGFNVIPTKDPDGDNNNFAKPIVIAPGDVWLGGDFGYTSASDPADIGSYVFVDINANGSFDMGSDVGLLGITVALVNDTDEDGVWDDGEKLVATTITSADGSYNFPDLTDDKYLVVVTDVNNVITEMVNNADPDGGTSGQSAVTLTGTDVTDQNFGYVPVGHSAAKGLVGDMIFLDVDGNNVPSLGDTGIEGVEVQLLDGATDDVLEKTRTNENGLYLFGNLDAGNYKVKVEATSVPSGLTNTIDSDGSAPGDNITNSFSLLAATSEMTKDFGYRSSVVRTISGTIWEDENAEGTLDGTETTRFENVSVFLYDADGDIIAITTTDASGNYIFTGIANGTYTIDITDGTDVLSDYWHTTGTDSEAMPKTVTLSDVNTSETGVDFGYYQKEAAVGNFVWLDYNEDGIQDADEPGLEGAKVTLNIDYNGGGTDLSVATITGTDGSYSFEKLLLDEDYQGDGTGTEPTYQIVVTPPNASFTATANIGAGGNDNLDSDTHSGVAVVPTQGKRNIALTNVTDSEASFDFAYNFVCDAPNADYAISTDASASGAQTTNYFLESINGTTKHLSKTQGHGTIRATTYCTHGDWRYYFNPLDPDEYLFAVRMNAGGGGTFNTTEIEYIELEIDDNATDRYVIGPNDATFVMMRDWHVKTVDDAALTANVDVRFYFPPNEFEKMFDDAVAQATTTWGVGAPDISDVVWFEKTAFDPDADIDATASTLSLFDITTKENASTAATGDNTLDVTMDGAQAVGNSKNHIQFNNISTFGGGTAMITINRAALPVKLTQFEGIEEGCNIRLVWVTESEENFSHYEIQRSEDGENFETVETVEGKGGNTTRSYQYQDERAGENNYYRLKMVDKDGTSEFSNTVNARTNCGDEKTLSIYPNPINGKENLLNVKFYSDRDDIQLVITDMRGQKVKAISLEVEREWNTISLDISNLPAGVYHLLQTGNGSSKKFIVTE